MNASSALARLALAAVVLAAAAAFAADKPKPWKGDGHGRGVLSTSVEIVHVAWEGNASHIGRYKADANHVFSGNLEFEGAATFTALPARLPSPEAPASRSPSRTPPSTPTWPRPTSTTSRASRP